MINEDLDGLETRFGVKLPWAYRQFMATHGPGEMDSHPDYYVMLYAPETVEAVNLDVEFVPGLFFIGSDGSRETARARPPA